MKRCTQSPTKVKSGDFLRILRNFSEGLFVVERLLLCFSMDTKELGQTAYVMVATFSRRVFRMQKNIYDRTFIAKIVSGF